MSHKRNAQTLVATVVGNWLEFFDFGVYTYFAVMIGKQFFPVKSEFGQLLLSLTAFGVGFVMRPLGGVLLGAYADRAGRKAALTATILIMALGTAMIAFTPPYSAIGIAAPIAIVVARLLQGFSAGGEVGAATSYLVEVAPPGFRGIYGSFQGATQGLASVTGASIGWLLSVTLSEQALATWGFRIPFALGILIAPIGIWIRNRLPETIHADAGARSTMDVLRGLMTRDYARPILVGLCAIIGGTVSSYVLGHYMTTYALTVLKMPTSIAMLVSVAAGLSLFVGAILGGWASDRFGRVPLMVIPRVVLAIASLPVFAAIIDARTPTTLIVGTVFLMFAQAMSGSVLVVCLPESFPRAVRSLGVSVVYAVGVTIFGGTAQIVVTWLVEVTKNPMAPAWYLAAANVLSAVAMAMVIVPKPHEALD